MATAQVESATTAFHDEKVEEQPIKKTEDVQDIKNTDDQETTVTEAQPQEQEAVDTTVAPEPEVAAPELEAEPEPKAEPEPEAEVEALATEVETKAVLNEEEEEGKVIPVDDHPAKVAPEPCVEEEAKETEEPEGKAVETGTITEPTEVTKAEVEGEPEEEKKEEGGAAEAVV